MKYFSMCLGVVFFLNIATAARTVNYKFPEDFKFGAATAAYQIEGAWNVSDKSPSVWDVYTHMEVNIVEDHSNADVACNSYYEWERDVEMASELGLHFYRFSISWPRILPTGFTNHISADGANYYNKLIDKLLEKNIEPVVTMYHYDLPQKLQDLGGWQNPLIVDWFTDYAKVLYSLYADRVKTWFTFNEGLLFCGYAMNTGAFGPPIKSPGIGDYLCNKHILLAHAKAWRVYNRKFKPKYKGKVSILNHLMWTMDNDNVSAEIINQFGVGMYSHPIYSAEGGWPPVIEEKIAEKSAQEGYTRSRLPRFTPEEILLVKGTYDFYGFNYYTSRIARKAGQDESVGPWPFSGAPEFGISITVDPSWHNSNFWFYVYPKGIREVLNWIKKNYGDIEIFIAENGYLSRDSRLDDFNRALYIRQHLHQILLAIHEDKINITAYTVWSLMDNFEWAAGYRSKMGLYAVDFEDVKRKRTPRFSANYYANIISNHSLIPLGYTTYSSNEITSGARTILSFLATRIFLLLLTSAIL